MNATLFGLRFVFSHHVLGKTPPLIRGLVLTNRCNLHCAHCRVAERGPQDLDFAEVTSAVDAFHREGGRCLYLEGGEPFLWRDGQHTLEDIVRYTRGRGYVTVVVYTNGTFPIATSASTVFVSVDGLRETHDALRGVSFDRIMANIRESTHPSLFVNFTVNRRNRGEVEAFCDHMDAVPRVRGVFFYFHTPYYGYDELYLEPDERREVLERLLRLRKRHRILNSRAGLLAALRNDWKRPVNACSVYEKGTVYPCCRFSNDPGLCLECGYLSYAEIDQTLRLKPSAIRNALKYF